MVSASPIPPAQNPPPTPESGPLQVVAGAQEYRLSLLEAVPLLALLISLVALSIDGILPALPAMASSLGVVEPNRMQLVISAVFAGLSAGLLIFGPMSDCVGRKPAIYAGLLLLMVGDLVAARADSFAVVLLGRFLQGLGSGSPRVVVLAIVRDQYRGREMARLMSLVSSVFIIVPTVAPAIGHQVLIHFGWRWIFGLILVLAFLSLVWFAWRYPETLPASRRSRLEWSSIVSGVRQTFTTPVTLVYTLCSTLIFAAFVAYLSSAQQIFADVFSVTHDFPYYFGVLALGVGAASLANAKLVYLFGMRGVCGAAMLVMGLSGAVGLLWDGAQGGTSIQAFMVSTFLCFLCVGFFYGNVHALALEPLGHIAGIAAAATTGVQMLVAVGIGYFLGQAYDQTVRPLFWGFTLAALASYGLHLWFGKICHSDQGATNT